MFQAWDSTRDELGKQSGLKGHSRPRTKKRDSKSTNKIGNRLWRIQCHCSFFPLSFFPFPKVSPGIIPEGAIWAEPFPPFPSDHPPSSILLLYSLFPHTKLLPVLHNSGCLPPFQTQPTPFPGCTYNGKNGSSSPPAPNGSSPSLFSDSLI